MAGSYHHCLDDETGKFRFDLIENMGDAHEACHMMFWMIWWLAQDNPMRVQSAENAYYLSARKGDFGPPGDM